MTTAMRLRDLEQTITRLQNLSDKWCARKIPVGNPVESECAKQQRADGVELRQALMPLQAVNVDVFRALLDALDDAE